MKSYDLNIFKFNLLSGRFSNNSENVKKTISSDSSFYQLDYQEKYERFSYWTDFLDDPKYVQVSTFQGETCRIFSKISVRETCTVHFRLWSIFVRMQQRAKIKSFVLVTINVLVFKLEDKKSIWSSTLVICSCPLVTRSLESSNRFWWCTIVKSALWRSRFDLKKSESRKICWVSLGMVFFCSRTMWLLCQIQTLVVIFYRWKLSWPVEFRHFHLVHWFKYSLDNQLQSLPVTHKMIRRNWLLLTIKNIFQEANWWDNHKSLTHCFGMNSFTNNKEVRTWILNDSGSNESDWWQTNESSSDQRLISDWLKSNF